jgi:hypothetical protein
MISPPNKIVVAYDLDDTKLTYHPAFEPWLAEVKGVQLGRPQTNGFRYDDRHPDLQLDWDELIDDFTQNHSLDWIQPLPGVHEHLEAFKDIVHPVVVTARPAIHRSVTEAAIKKFFPDYYLDLSQQLIMPDEHTINGIKPSKRDICQSINAVAFFDDSVPNLWGNDPSHPTQAYLFRSDFSTWNHDQNQLADDVTVLISVPEDYEVVTNWQEATERLRHLIQGV